MPCIRIARGGDRIQVDEELLAIEMLVHHALTRPLRTNWYCILRLTGRIQSAEECQISRGRFS